MGSQCIFESKFERSLLPHGLHSNLLAKATAQLESKVSIMRQYRYPSKPADNSFEVYSIDGDPSSIDTTPAAPLSPEKKSSHHRRNSSNVRFADNLLSSSTPVPVDSPLSRGDSTNVHTKHMSRPPRPPTSFPEADNWLAGSPENTGKKVTAHSGSVGDTAAERGASTSILFPSSYGSLSPSSKRPEQDQSTNSSNRPAKPMSKTRKYWGNNTGTLGGPQNAAGSSVSSSKSAEKVDNLGITDRATEQQRQNTPQQSGKAEIASTKTQKQRKYWSSKTSASSGVPLSGTEKAAKAATDAFDRLLARPRGTKPGPAKHGGHGGNGHEYRDFYDPEKGASIGSFHAPSADGSVNDDTAGEPEKHPLLRSEGRESSNYNTAVSSWNQKQSRTDQDHE